MKVAAIQMVSGTDVPRNLQAAGRLLAEAAAAGAELAVLPEYFCLMGQAEGDKLLVAESPGSGPIQDCLADAASRLKLWIVGGTLPLASSDPARVRNSCLAYSPAGECVARYDKIHLFRFDDGTRRFDETRSIEPGTEPQRFVLTARDGSALTVGLSVCYDLRFPELYRQLAADLLVVPSAFTYPTGQAHWEVLLRARAIENLAAVVAPAQGGVHENGRRTWGHSVVIDAWGRVLAQQAEGEGVVLADIDAAAQAAVRSQLPALGHRVL